jgi:hypothetical protein
MEVGFWLRQMSIPPDFMGATALIQVAKMADGGKARVEKVRLGRRSMRRPKE